MRTDENTFEFLYYEELRLIPGIFRCTKAGFAIALIIMAISAASGAFFISKATQAFNGDLPVGSLSDADYMIFVFFCILVFALALIWLLVCRHYESTAYKKASKLAGMVLLDEHHKMLVTWKERKSCPGDY
jgi:hypothetical protein